MTTSSTIPWEALKKPRANTGQMPQPFVVTTFQHRLISTCRTVMAEHPKSVGTEAEGFL